MKKRTIFISFIVFISFVVAYILLNFSSNIQTEKSSIDTTELLVKIQHLLTPENRINYNTPLVMTQGNQGPIYIYKLPGTDPIVLVAQTSGAVDCDGKITSQCNMNTDPKYYNDTSFSQSDGKPLDAAILPYYVLPIYGPYFDYRQNGIKGGQLGAIIYGNNIEYGVFGDEDGSPNQIGEISYAMASSLGIDHDPRYGGVSSGVTFIIFTGSGNVVSPIENHSQASKMGNVAITTLISQLG